MQRVIKVQKNIICGFIHPGIKKLVCYFKEIRLVPIGKSFYFCILHLEQQILNYGKNTRHRMFRPDRLGTHT